MTTTLASHRPTRPFHEASYWHNGRRHVAPTTFATKGDARAFLSAVEADIRRGAWIDPSAGRLQVAPTGLGAGRPRSSSKGST